MSSPADRAPEWRRAAVPSALIALALGVWLSLPDKTYVFDGVVFAQVVERSVDEWRGQMLNPHHLLFNPFFQILRDALAGIGVSVGAYRLFQIVNAVAGAAGLLLFGDSVRRLSRDAALGWCAALILGATWSYGTRATEGQAYMLMSLGAIAVLWTSVRLLERPSAGRAVLVCVAAAAGALFHAADGFLLPAAAAALWLAFPKRRPAAAAGFAAAVAAILIPYLAAFRGVSLRAFLNSASDFHGGEGDGFWRKLFANFWAGGGVSPLRRAVDVWRETGMALAPVSGTVGLAAGLALWAGSLAAVAAAWPRLDAPRRAAAVVAALVWAGFTAVNAFWPGGPFFFVPAHACALALFAVAAGPRWSLAGTAARRRILGGLAAAGLSLGFWNVRAGLLPQSRIANAPGCREALYVGAHTEASSWVIITGLGFPNSKVYLAYFAHRGRIALEYYFLGQPKDEALRLIAAFAAGQISHGIPLYFLSDLTEPSSADAEMQRLWGVDPDEIRRAFGPGIFLPVASSPEERVSLFVPQAGRAELFVALGYSVLTGNDKVRLLESTAALREIARAMAPAERRRAAELMWKKNWGFDLLWEGLSPGMSAENKDATRARAKTFTALAGTSEFWLRAGNLYQMLGLNAETIDAWTRAQKISGDPRLSWAIKMLRSKT